MKNDEDLLGKPAEVDIPEMGDGKVEGTEVHEVIFSKIIPGHHEEYSEWAAKMRDLQKQATGYKGTFVQPPDEHDGFWTTILMFDSQQSLDKWLDSPARKELLKETKNFVEVEHLSRVKSSFPGWFPTDPVTGNGPPNWKAALLVLLGLFPIVMLEMKFLNPVVQSLGIHASPATFFGNAVSVALTSFITMPVFVRLFDWWLFPKSNPTKMTWLGLCLLAVLFLVEVLALTLLIP